MKKMKSDRDGKSAVVIRSLPPSPPPLPPVPRHTTVLEPRVDCVTKREIAKYWKRKRMVEEDHLNAAIKAAARLRARNLSEDDYKRFEESLIDDDESRKESQKSTDLDLNMREIRVGIKDWWTKSKYAYLNQPAIKSMDIPKRLASTYVPQFYCYKSAPPSVSAYGIC